MKVMKTKIKKWSKEEGGVRECILNLYYRTLRPLIDVGGGCSVRCLQG